MFGANFPSFPIGRTRPKTDRVHVEARREVRQKIAQWSSTGEWFLTGARQETSWQDPLRAVQLGKCDHTFGFTAYVKSGGHEKRAIT